MINLTRFENLIGSTCLEHLKKSKVLVVGVGGVGGYAVEALARAGVGHLRIVDYDKVDETNLNRQIIALQSTIGQYKVDVMKERILDINPEAVITANKDFVNEDNIEDFVRDVDFVVDACDTVATKLEIIKICKKKNIPFISCMGTGNKMDPTRLKIMDIKKTSYDPLAKRIRKFVKDNRINGKVMVVCSDETRYSDITSPIPSNSFVPATAGLLISSYVVNEIIK